MSKEAAAAEAAEFAALLDELGGDEPSAAEAAQVQEADTSDESEDAPETDGDGEPAENEDESAAPEAEKPLEAVETEAGKLIEAGDLEGAAKKLGIDPKLFKLDKRQFAAMRKGLADAKRKETEALTAKQRAERLQADAEKTYGPIAAGFAALKAGDGSRLRAAIELMCEAPFEEVVGLVQKANKPVDPATAEVLRLRRELAERDAKQQQAQAAAAAELKAKADVGAIEKRLADTPLAKVPGAAKEIYDRVKASFDGIGYAVTVREAYAQVKAEKAKIAEALTGKKPGKPTPAKKPLAPVRKDYSQMSPAQAKAAKAAAERAEFEATLKEAEEAVKAEIRRGRRAR
jgi:hypothetical protein